VVLHKRPNPAEAINSPQKEAILGPNFSHTIPAGNPRDIPKFDIDPNNSTEKRERKQYHLNEKHFFSSIIRNFLFSWTVPLVKQDRIPFRRT
jgi:hypothetical protein